MSDASDLKVEQYSVHVRQCRACVRCAGLINLSGCAHPSPWANWMGSMEACVVVVGKDFSGAQAGYQEPKLDLPTNRNLRELIRSAGLDERRDVYLTNAILCIKPGKMSAEVQPEWVRNCSPLLRRTIEIVAPQAVAALGAVAWRAVGQALGIRTGPLARSVGGPPVATPRGLSLFAFNHPGGLGLVRRPMKRQIEDWQHFGTWLAAAGRRAA